MDDQPVKITLPCGRRHQAIGSPDLIAARLETGQEILCESRRAAGHEYVLRVLPATGIALTYSEAVMG